MYWYQTVGTKNYRSLISRWSNSVNGSGVTQNKCVLSFTFWECFTPFDTCMFFLSINKVLHSVHALARSTHLTHWHHEGALCVSMTALCVSMAKVARTWQSNSCFAMLPFFKWFSFKVCTVYICLYLITGKDISNWTIVWAFGFFKVIKIIGLHKPWIFTWLVAFFHLQWSSSFVLEIVSHRDFRMSLSLCRIFTV